MKVDLRWWIENMENQVRNISHGNADLVLVTDASLSGWGVHCKNQKIGGRWTEQEANHHINYLKYLRFSMVSNHSVRNVHTFLYR